ncbi:hypothetical protein ACFOOK_25700 [Micromonospora krabiensis]|uniref:Uncharacterized protein n=1 Tax=Micromonospora krabiensis TaxID=307121 RepID=A0A1C3N636_9ACTN|nr:hypothetical protein [Micromonospora krabiensis]SBV28040.1 hypothetical protein GA0070620_3572 [Micromonospora krabiensis]
MRDDLTFAERVRRDLHDVRWPGPEELRARARRRSRRRIVAATAVLAIAGSTAVALGTPGGSLTPAQPAASAAPDATPTQHEITTDALLQPSDLPSPVEAQLSQAGMGEPVRVDAMLDQCRTNLGLPEGWQVSRLSRSQTLLRARPAGTEPRNADVLVMQDVYRLGTQDEATLALLTLQHLVDPCDEWRSRGPYDWKGQTGTAEVVHRWQVRLLDSGGNGGLLLSHTMSRARDVNTGATFGDVPRPTDTAVVQVGDLVSVLSLGRDGTEAQLQQFAVAAVARMCANANAPPPNC